MMDQQAKVTQSKKISVIGLGKLGAPLVAVLAKKGHTVIGVDTDINRVDLLNAGKAPVFEPGLAELLRENQSRISATVDYEVAVKHTNLTFIIVPTPSQPDGDFSVEYVLEAAKRIGQVLANKNEFHLVVLTSTVTPGTTSRRVLPVLESYSGKQCGRDFGLCYNPEFIALGSVLWNMFNPDFVLIGESDPDSGQILEDLYKQLCENNPPVARMNFVNAELSKLAVNTFVTTRISYANMLAQVCEKLPDADVDVVTSAIGLDSRIGKKYLKGALGYGGPCFPRDNVAFTQLAQRLGSQAVLAEATDRLNRQQVPRLVEIIRSHLPQGGKVGVLGLAYKPDTNVVEEAQGLEIAQLLVSHGVPVVVYDPAALENAQTYLKEQVAYATSMSECVRSVDVVVITTPWNEFMSLSPEMLNYSNGKPTLIDCWRILPFEQFDSAVNYVALGVGPQLSPESGPVALYLVNNQHAV